MRFNKLDLNQLVVLDAVLAEKSVRRAADRLFLSAPATSCALARLRDYFDDELLQQVGRRMVLTPKAESLRKPVRDVLMQIQGITTTSPTFDPYTSTRKLVVESSDYVMNVFLGEVLRRAWHEAPQMQFDLRVIGPHSHADFDSGEVDLLLVPGFFAAPGHPSEPMFDDTWSCVVWEGNTEVGACLRLDEYLSMGHVVIEWGAGRLSTFDETEAARAGHVRRREVTAPSFTLVPQLLIGTCRVATLQTRLAHSLAAAAPLKVLPCPIPLEPLQEQVQWHKYQAHDPALIWFRALMHRVAEELSDGLPLRPEAAMPAAAQRGTADRGGQLRT